VKQLDKVKQLTEELKALIAQEPAVVEFNRLAKEVEQSDVLRTMEEQLKEYQQTMVQALSRNNQDLHAKTLAAYKKLEDDYFNHPLYANYMHYKEEVNDLMQEVIKILNDL
jgi:cell fate (sporulation/competence/biofilm development) regulator YmcA (YheA/YmcA/DUF963 family)